MVNESIIRFWEIDLLRGIAVVMMIFFHFLYDLNFFEILCLNLYKGYFLLYVYIGGMLFFILVGVSLTLSYSIVKMSFTKNKLRLKFISRGLKIFGLGLFITFISYIFLNEGFIVFGALHCIGLSIILAYPFLNFRYINLLFGSILIFFGIILKSLTFDFYWLLWVGFIPKTFYTVDYFPIVPWLGIILIGIFIGNEIYSGHVRKFNLIDISDNRIIRLFTFLGKHSLIIYFIHQPILLSIIYLYLNYIK